MRYGSSGALGLALAAMALRGAAVGGNGTERLALLHVPESSRQLVPGTRVRGYELLERMALLGVCNHAHVHHAADEHGAAARGLEHKAKVTTAVVAVPQTTSQALAKWGKALTVCAVDGAQPVTLPTCANKKTPQKRMPLADGPALEYQCMLQDVEHIYVNRNYRLRKKFAAGSHGEVWRATNAATDAGQGHVFVLKRLFVERGPMMIEMGLREAHFGTLLAHETHIARFVEYFFMPIIAHHDADQDSSAAKSLAQSTPAPLTLEPGQAHEQQEPPTRELWLVFHDEGMSLRHYLYTMHESTHSAVLFESSRFWHGLRMDDKGEDVLREIMRQIFEGVAALHDQGITHRDIKPSNILVNLRKPHDWNSTANPPMIVKIADFGSAVDEYTLRHLYGDKGPSQAEETREYQPPEALFSSFGAAYDSFYPLAYDMWSVGVVFLEILLGSPQVFQISPRARAKLDARLRGKDEATKRKSYLLYVLTHEFCIYQPSAHELQALWNQYALVSEGCSFGRFNTTVIERDPMGVGLRNPWGLDLMWKMLQWHPSQRISARAALNHAYFKGPYVCQETKRMFATKAELKLHQAYLEFQHQRERARAFMVSDKYELPLSFECPYCHRKFSTIASCQQHLHARQHDRRGGTSFCEFEDSGLLRAVRAETSRMVPIRLPGVGVALLQGKRTYMEDMVVLRRHALLGFTMYAVIDGHLGVGAVEYIAKNVFAVLSNRLAAIGDVASVSAREIQERVVLRQVFLELHEGFLAHTCASDPAPDFSGGTLTLVVHFPDQARLVCANVGDSSALFVSRTGELTRLTVAHWPHVPSERIRIESSGGFVSFHGLWRVVGQLAVSRSLGDRHLRQYVTAEPSIRHLDLRSQHGTLVIASDGVWDALSEKEVVMLVQERRPSFRIAVAEELAAKAYVWGSLDNIAVVVVDV